MTTRVMLNVSGTRFEMHESTWSNIKRGMPTPHWCNIHGDGDQFFVERHAGAFGAVLNFYQADELHLPTGLCPSVFKKELDFWGIAPSKLDKCCFTKYIGFFDDLSVLKILEDDERQSIQQGRSLLGMVAQGGWAGIQARVWLVLEEPFYSVASKIYFGASAIVIMLSLFSLVAGTHKSFQRDLTREEWKGYLEGDYYDYFDSTTQTSQEPSTQDSLRDLPEGIRTHHEFLLIIEIVCLPLFAIDLFARLLFCPFRKRMLCSFLIWVDIFALAVTCTKYLVEAVRPQEKYEQSVVDILHCLQIVRVFRLFRLVKNFVGFRVLLYAFRASLREMCLMMLFLIVAMLLFSAFVFFSGDEKFQSIPDAFWWAIVTMTTVGYGDLVPTQGLSKVIGAFCALAGVCLIAVIIPIFVNNFMLFYSYSKIWGKKEEHVLLLSNKLSPLKEEREEMSVSDGMDHLTLPNDQK